MFSDDKQLINFDGEKNLQRKASILLHRQLGNLYHNIHLDPLPEFASSHQTFAIYKLYISSHAQCAPNKSIVGIHSRWLVLVVVVRLLLMVRLK